MFNNVRNWFGLPFLSANISGTTTLNAGNTTTANGYFYPETAQPQLQLSEYDFWDYSPIPGSSGFSTTNKSDILIAPVGGSIMVNGYAKLAVLNGYSGVYAYLGQYFTTNALKLDASGNITTNTTGILSPYGNFFATEPGAAALVTMPDIDTGQQGTATVYCVGLVLDKNHDGTIDGSFSGQDATSQASPMEWWINNDYDFTSGSADPFGHDIKNDFRGNYQDPAIACPRDLEDFARLWICGMPALTNGNFQVKLSMSAVSGSPAINLVNAVETNGGTLYLADTNTAVAQCVDSWGVGPGQKYRTIDTTNVLTLPANLFTNAGNKYFLFEGAGIGEGQLTLTISQNGNTIAQTGVWLDLHEVKDFYERAVITNNMSGAISNWSSGIQTIQYATASPDPNGDTNIIVYVHGGANDDFSWRERSDTIFRRLYWAGYQGKVATVRWPSPTKIQIVQYRLEWFNQSELIAYKSAPALKDYLNQIHSRLPNYNVNLLPQSLGGAVVGEALTEGAPFDTLILCQNSMSASCYDVNAPTNADLLAAETSVSATPDWQPWGYHGVYTNLTGRIVNYFNTNDVFLNDWIFDQINYKAPDSVFSYDGTNSYYYGVLITDPQESRAFVARSRTLAIGEQGPGIGQISQGIIQSAIDLHAQFGIGPSTEEHSAFYTRPIQTIRPFYIQIIRSINP